MAGETLFDVAWRVQAFLAMRVRSPNLDPQIITEFNGAKLLVDDLDELVRFTLAFNDEEEDGDDVQHPTTG